MRVFKTKELARFCRQERLNDERLLAALQELEAGKIDAALGGEVFKQRIARPGGGKSGGYRTIIFFRAAHRTIFALAFAKNDRENLSAKEVAALRDLAPVFLGFDDDDVRAMLDGKEWIEVKTNG